MPGQLRMRPISLTVMDLTWHRGNTAALQVGPYICVLKTHVDIFDQWDAAIVQQLQQLAQQHGEADWSTAPAADLCTTSGIAGAL